MTSSGTYTWTLDTGGILLEGFDRAGIRPVEITREQMTSGIRSLNLELSSWNSNPVNLWAVELITIPLVAGTSTYVLDAKYQLVTDVYASLVQSGQPNIDRILVSISRDTYATYPQKSMQGPPTVFWFQRLETPQITVWPVPDGTTATNICCYAMRRVQDVNSTGSQNVDIPFRFLDVLCAKLAERIAFKYNEQKYPMVKAAAEAAYSAAYIEDQERAGIFITPDFGVWQV